MADWSLTGKRDTEKNYTTTNTIRSYVIVMHIPIIEDVPEGAVEWDLVISHYGCTKKILYGTRYDQIFSNGTFFADVYHTAIKSDARIAFM